jgi:hypothetical protein
MTGITRLCQTAATRFRPLFIIGVFSLLCGAIAADEMDDSEQQAATPEELSAALGQAERKPGSPFRLQVNCTDQKGSRSFILFPGGVTIWNGRSQVMLPVAAQTGLLTTLLERGFPEFAAIYGGQKRPGEAAARVSCRIGIELEPWQKSSEQRSGGEQSAQLAGLAAALLDQVEPFAGNGVIPVSLQDGLDKLAGGQLAPQSLRLRFVDVPTRSYVQPGSVLRLRGGKASRQTYSPGRADGEKTLQPLQQEQFLELILALQAAQLDSLPGKLWSEDQLELEVQVLAFRKTILARPFKRLDRAALEPEQQRFDTLLPSLREMGR